MTLKLFSLTLNFCAFASTVRCSFYRGALCKLFSIKSWERTSKASHKSCFQRGLVCSQTDESHCSWTFSSPPSLGEAARIHTHTQLEILQAHWKCRGGRGHAWTGLSVNTTWHDFHKVSGFSWHLTPQRCVHLLVYEPVFPLEWGPTPRWGSIYFWFSEFKKRTLYKIQNLKKGFAFYSLCWEYKRAI